MERVLWQPTAELETLKARAQFLQAIRDFFHQRNVFEVDTPLLCHGVATDPFLHAFSVHCAQLEHPRYLQTSPEYAMKRLVAAGSGPIYYLGKAFRKGEVGTLHNPEFTMLEWYRPHWDHLQLIKEVETLMQIMIGCPAAEIKTYHDIFAENYGINPHLATIAELQSIAIKEAWINSDDFSDLDRDGWLDLILTHGIEPTLGQNHPTVITDYPASQASLAKVRTINGPQPYQVAERFEFYLNGIELANGYHELACAIEQRQRFEQDLIKRKALGLSDLPIDHYLLSALSAGFPACAGVALGVDRLFMLKRQERNIAKVLPFAWKIA